MAIWSIILQSFLIRLTLETSGSMRGSLELLFLKFLRDGAAWLDGKSAIFSLLMFLLVVVLAGIGGRAWREMGLAEYRFLVRYFAMERMCWGWL